MHLSSLRLNNFRLYGPLDQGRGLEVQFRPGLNLIVGENDSGKSCIIDALQLVLHDESHGWMRVDEDDFHGDAHELAIECIFRGITDDEARNLLEWLSFDEHDQYFLKITLKAERRREGIFSDIRAGGDEEGAPLSRLAREAITATYLKPLRDAERELSPGKRSRLARILGAHPELTAPDDADHDLVQAVSGANETIRSYFADEDGQGNAVFERLSTHLTDLRRETSTLAPKIDLADPSLRNILEKLELRFGDGIRTPGLGSHNLLFIAAELLLLRQDGHRLKLALIEELEAHLDSQAKLRVIEFLEKQSAEQGIQLIVSTHSPILASVIDLEGLIICRNGKAFSMDSRSTRLDVGDYAFLRRFLDATKANLFFAAGVIIVEGPSENILLPTLTKILTGKTLAKHGVSLVNVGGVSLLRYAKIFHRQDGTAMGLPVSCVTDRDIPPDVAKTEGLVGTGRKTESDFTPQVLQHKQALLDRLVSPDVRAFRSPRWTLEYDFALSELGVYQHQAIKLAELTKDGTVHLTPQARQAAITSATTEYDAWKNTLSPELRACKVYAPLANEKASKAAAAEHLAEILEQQNEADAVALRQKLDGDQHLKYLVGAIRHATNTPAGGAA